MNNKALVVIDLQNDITKHYRDIIDTVNEAIDWAQASGVPVAYIRHHNLSASTRTFKPGTRGAEFVPELKVVSDDSFRQDEGQRIDERGVRRLYPGKRHHRVLYRRG